MKLTKDQQKALKNIQVWYSSSKEYKSLIGYAGTGKTTLLNEIANRVDAEVAVTATTNKAVKVLTQKVKRGSKTTIHSLLNLRPVREKNIETFKVKDKREGSKIKEYDLIIIDESSMLNERLFNIISKTKRKKTKVLFCGDPAQLNPVSEEMSKSLKCHPVELTEVIRHGDVISKAGEKIRLHNSDLRSLISPPFIEGYTKQSLIESYKNFSSNPDKARTLAWTNKKVKRLNKSLREFEYEFNKKEVPSAPYTPGEIVIVNETVSKGKRVLIPNCMELRIKKVKEYPEFWRLNFGNHKSVLVPKEDYEPVLKKKLRTLAVNKDWKLFWQLKDKFTDITHCYAMTVHKSQGSTFDNVFIDQMDLNRNRDVSERKKLKYVALTRASKKVIIL